MPSVFSPRPHDAGRRRLLALLPAALALGACAGSAELWAPPAVTLPDDAALLDDLERRTFDFFWQTTNRANGLAADRWPTRSFSSIAAVGFALSAYPVGVGRGWISREQARERTLNTLRFFHDAPQGPSARGMIGHRGFYYHFLDMASGERFGDCELSTVDTALLLAGVLHAAVFFDGNHAAESQIRSLAEALTERVDWRWAQHRPPSICHGWTPENGFIANDWKGYNEAMLVYILALGSPGRAVAPDAWSAWTSTYPRSWMSFQGQTHLHFAPLFGHQYSHCWIDFRGIRDAYMRERGFDYFENSRRATLAQRAYAQANPQGWAGYGGDIWGITACDGPADVRSIYRGRMRRFRSYAGRGAGGDETYDDGTLAPTAALASLPFAPEIVLPALRALRARYGDAIYQRYGFVDAFNPSFDRADVKLSHGRLVPGVGWVDTDHLGIDQGPISLMTANHRRDEVWQSMRRQPQIRLGLRRAGFAGGWLEQG